MGAEWPDGMIPRFPLGLLKQKLGSHLDILAGNEPTD